MRVRLLIPALLVGALVAAPEAYAHGLPGDPPSTVWGYIWLGLRHMVGGWDHLLFITGIVVLAGQAWRAAKLLSVFVLGHSTTLLAATLAGIHVNADVVDVVIASSVAFVGWRIYRGRPTDWRPTVAAIALFGLVHGLGLSTRLQDLRLPEGWTLVGRVLAFNLGVEIGQLLALSAILIVGLLALRLWPALRVRRPQAAAAFIGVGIVAAAVVSFLAVLPGASVAGREATVADDFSAATCDEEPYTPSLGEAAFGGHLDRAFFEPGEPTVSADLQHVMGDGYIIVVYNRSLPDQRRAELRSWVEQGRGVIGVPGATDMTDTIEALTVRKRLTCDALDIEALDSFRTAWFSGS